jgi:hypothetical protein
MFAFSGEDVGDIPDYNDNNRNGDRTETRFQLAEWCPSRGPRTEDDNGDGVPERGFTLTGTGLPGDGLPCTPGQATGRIFTFAPIPLWEENRPVTDGRTFGDNGKDPGNAHCSFIQPQYCELLENLYGVAGQAAPYLRAGGNGNWGRRTFQWHGGGEILLKYDRRNVLGFSMDFAEDVTKTNWGVEFTWIGNQPISDNESPDNISFVDSYNLTISMDRPTFVNFLNANRTFFVTTQWFFQYRNLKDSSWARIQQNGPWNILGILAIQTGYFQDRLLPNVTFVYDVNSVSGAVLPQFTYRFSENFSATVGAGIFFGRTQLVDMPLSSIGPASNRIGANQFQDGVENLLAVVRDRDELFLKLRYTF